MVSDTTCHMSISLDGFVAGPDQSREDPLGKRGRELHGWHIGDPRANDADKIANEWLMRPRGAYVMGRNMFGPIRGDWDEDWSGWWGPEPPYHAPVFVLTHHRHDPIQMDGGRRSTSSPRASRRTDPGLLLVGVRQRQADPPEPVFDLRRRVAGGAHGGDATAGLGQSG
jgi:dihydrofolate reductase